MKFFSFKILLLCILLPPLLYIYTVQLLEKELNRRYFDDIEQIYIGDTEPLFRGSLPLKDAVAQHIDAYLRGRRLIRMGAKVEVTVTTRSGRILYPPLFEEQNAPPMVVEPMDIAAENYRLLRQGLLLKVRVTLEYNTLLTNIILALYVLLFGMILYGYYRRGLHRARQQELESREEMARLEDAKRNTTRSLESLRAERQRLTAEFDRLQQRIEQQKSAASRNEDQMLEEIESLEMRIQENLSMQQAQQEEIDALRERIRHYEKVRKSEEKQKVRAVEAAGKRFRTLYKKLTVHPRAVEGYVELTDDMRIKAEEIVHQLNENPEQVPIKRKVFGRKGMETVLEVIFAYNGRLYFRRRDDQRIEVLVIGTKNTQNRDLGFIKKIASA
ncbi:MAG: hypothetical protein DSZ00_01485 [Gammaproteobacteria bacterium]|nr:MAG: hypothetical protein DSZ00_01485 [Gammaproteobacteria bacterium]